MPSQDVTRLILKRPHSTQATVIENATRFTVLACGRRWGKNVLGEDRLVRTVLAGKPAAFFGPTYKNLSEAWRRLEELLLPVTARKSVTDRRLELVTGGTLEFWSLDEPNAARGRAYARVVVDEAAMVPSLLDAWQLVIRPTLADHRGDGWFLSTPAGLNGFHTLFQWGQDAETADWSSWQFPTASNPHLDAAEIEAARWSLPDRAFAQEWLAQFLSDGTGVFRRVIDQSTATPQPVAVAGHRYVFGVDWGKLSDFTAISVLDLVTKEQVHLERFSQIDYYVQLQRLAVLRERFRPVAILAERNSVGEPILEQLRRDGWPVYGWVATNATKAAAIEALALALERGELRILPDRVQRGELLAYDATRLPSGVVRYSAPDGLHDDTVIALALSWLLGAAPPGQLRQVDFEMVA